MTTKQSGAGFPFAGNVLESLELMQKVWGAGLAQLPGLPSAGALMPSVTSMMVPTLDVDELDKRIGDLRAVEQWLALNASMLRASIQALEVQRNTIATLKTLGGTLLTPAPQAAARPAPAPAELPAAAGPSTASAASSTSRRTRRTPTKQAPAPNLVEMPLNPATWWGTLQDQFTRIAAAAAAQPPAKAPAASEENKPAARRPPNKRAS
jgi:hypothetical protein